MQKIVIEGIPTIIWGEKSDTVFIYVHGKMSNKEVAKTAAAIAEKKNYQVLSFDLPEHGERVDNTYPCNIWNGINDLKIIMQYARKNWGNINLIANSLGAYFSLNAYKEIFFDKVLFISPIVDMKSLIENMMFWFNVTKADLKEKGIIEIPIETLDWKYYSYVCDNPISKWKSKTKIFYGEADDLQSREMIEGFAKNFDSEVTILNNGSHALMEPEEKSALAQWLLEQI